MKVDLLVKWSSNINHEDTNTKSLLYMYEILNPDDRNFRMLGTQQVISNTITYNENSSRNLRLYCFLSFMVWNRGSLITSGHTAGHGVPHVLLISSNCAISWFAWNIGFLVKNSPNIHL